MLFNEWKPSKNGSLRGRLVEGDNKKKQPVIQVRRANRQDYTGYRIKDEAKSQWKETFPALFTEPKPKKKARTRK